MAQEAEETKTVTYKGETYTVPKFVLEDLDALEAFEDGRFSKYVRAVLGAAQYATFRKTSSTASDMYELGSLLLSAGEESDDKE